MFQTKIFSKVTASHLKEHNETLILREIYAHKTISRVKLAQLTHLSKPSVTELTQSLIKKGLITEAGQGKVTDQEGERPTLLGFYPHASQIISVLLSHTPGHCMLLHLPVHIIVQKSLPANGATST